ncbi:uncharacterized protein [Enoplosus armatus]|uniref:uncharacterized protein n=1 Tax=Enoplosus armatus TaxID=215367 RepID=UPI0039940458
MFVLYCVIALIVIIGIIGIIGMLCLYLPWKRELRKQHNTAEVSQLSFLRYLQTSSCLRKVISQPETGQAEEPRLSDKPSPTGSQDDIEEDDTLESVHVHSIDLKADGEAPQSLSLHCNLSKEGIQLSKNGHTSTPDANSAYDHRAMHRNLGDDPRGVIDNKGKDIVKILEVRGGRTLGDGGPEDHEIEGQPLLSAIQHFDMKGEAAALVNRRGQDPDPVSRGSTAPDTDVESTPNMKN